MGFGQSKPKTQELQSDLQGSDLLDIIATKYILTQNFQDMKNLSNKKYCNDLVIITKKVMKKYLKNRDIKYLAERVDNGVPYNRMENEKLTYLDTKELSPSSKQRFSKKELDKFAKEEKEARDKAIVEDYEASRRRDYYGGGYQNGGFFDFLRSDERDNYPRRAPANYYPRRPRATYKPRNIKRKTLLSEMDVRNTTQKDRMCKGIARFYITIAHLYAAIVKTINPVYIFEDSKGNKHAYSIMNRDKIPAGALPKLSEIQEPGVPELEQLYYDDYNYTKGKFVGITTGGDSRTEYFKDLKEFYEAFTGKNDYDQWNASGTKKFSDIPLIAYHSKSECADKSSWRTPIKGSGGIFTTYANHLKSMIDSAQQNQAELLDILKEVFKIQQAGNDEKTQIVTLAPDLNEKKLEEDIIPRTRKAIVKLYIQCEKEIKKGIDIFESILSERAVKLSGGRRKVLLAARESLYSR